MHFPDFEPWGEEEAAEACVWGALIPAEEAQVALKLILSGEHEAAAGSLARSINVAAYYAEAGTDTKGRAWLQSVVDGKKSGANRSKNSKDIKAEWQETAALAWKKRPLLTKTEIAETIVKEMIDHNAEVAENKAIKVYSVGYISRNIDR
ncbi:MAG: hypothetical protein QNL05_04755 [Gammaproteobacteria bacterium]|nr:hypothetical protein [Gammaproteobacteria bacterium]